MSKHKYSFFGMVNADTLGEFAKGILLLALIATLIGSVALGLVMIVWDAVPRSGGTLRHLGRTLMGLYAMFLGTAAGLTALLRSVRKGERGQDDFVCYILYATFFFCLLYIEASH